MEDHSFTANGHMDDIIYQQECSHHHVHNGSSSAAWKYADWEHHIHGCESSSAMSKEHLNSQYFLGGELPDFVCLDDCHDPSCDEPPCTECDEDVVVCTNAACSPPPDQGTCDAVAIGNTSCAGEVPCDVLRGATVLNVLLQQSSNENSHLQQPPFTFNHPTHPGCFVGQDQSFGQGPYFNTFGNSNSNELDVVTSQSFCPSQELGLNGASYLGQCYSLAPQGAIPVQLQQRNLPAESSMQTSHSPNNGQLYTSVPLRNSASVSSASSQFSPTTQNAYAFSEDSTPSNGTPFQEALIPSYSYAPSASYKDRPQTQSNTRCLYLVNDEECGKLFNNTADLLKHVQGLHNASLEKEVSYIPSESIIESPIEHSDARCLWLTDDKECGQVFENAGELQNHIQEWHTATLKKADGFVCQWSGCVRRQTQPDKAGFAQRSKLDRHIQSHTGFKACTCTWEEADGSECGKHFSTQQSLTLHQRTHTGERPHKCEHEGCDYAAAQASQLTMHVRTRHTKVKPLVCPFPGCGASFSESSNLSKHKKIHQPGEKCICTLCERVFRRPDQLKRHMNTTHKSVAAKVQHRRSISQSGGISLEIPLATWQV